MGEQIRNFYQKSWSYSEKVSVTSLAACAGIVAGFLIAPIKGSRKIKLDHG